MREIVSPLDGFRSPLGVRRGGGFSPASLFAGGEQGAWYDPSDKSTLFQDSAGTTPVTASGQPVGLMLDKSKGQPSARRNLLIYTEDFTNPSWSKTETTVSAGISDPFGGSTANKIIPTATVGAHTVAQIVGVTGATQTVYAKNAGYNFVGLTFNNSGALSAFFNLTTGEITSVGASVTASIADVGDGWFRLSISASGTVGFIRNYISPTASFGPFAGDTTSGVALWGAQANSGLLATTYQKITDGENGEWTPGNHAAQATAAARPTYTEGSGLAWLAFDGVDDAMATAAIDSTAQPIYAWAGVEHGDFTGSSFNYIFDGISADDRILMGFKNPDAGVESSAISLFAGNELLSGDVFDRNTAYVISAKYLGASSGASKNGVSISSGNAGSGPFTGIKIGSRFSEQQYLSGKVYGLIVRGAASSAGEIASAESYLAAKSGVTL